MSATSARQRKRAPRYRRRRPIPALLLLAVLVVLSGLVWTRVFETADNIAAATRCNLPNGHPVPAPPAGDGTRQVSYGKMLPRDALNNTTPVPQQDIRVRVFNGNGEHNQATFVTEELLALGFTQGGEPADDPVYPNYNLKCHGQLRFGGAGAGAARTLSLVVPCAQLVRDDRKDATVDLALGSEFDEIRTTQEAKQVLQDLKNWNSRRDGRGSAQQDVHAPPVSEELLAKARDVHC